MTLLFFHVKKHIGAACIPSTCLNKNYNLHAKFMILIVFSFFFFLYTFFGKKILFFYSLHLASLYHSFCSFFYYSFVKKI